MLRSVFAHHKEGRLNPLVVEDLQNRLGVLGRAVVKGEVAIFLSAAVVCGFGDGLIERGFRALIRRETLRGISSVISGSGVGSAVGSGVTSGVGSGVGRA